MMDSHETGLAREPVTIEQEARIAQLALAGGEPVSTGRWPASLSRRDADDLIASLEVEVAIRAARIRCQSQIRDMICARTLDLLRETREQVIRDVRIDAVLAGMEWSKLDFVLAGRSLDFLREEIVRFFGELASATHAYREWSAV